jgi:DNA processing protein
MLKEIRKISINDSNYPVLLKKIKNPPKFLYCLGELKNKESCFAIVGTRKCSPYGKEVAFRMASELAEAGLTIVSGFAPGVDTFAHLGALEKGKRTIAVLGTGLDKKSIYPKQNLKLIDKILEKGGCLISEFPPEIRGTKFTFPKRNRIISGLSLGVLIVEARLKSGALITANFAKEQKRKVFAVPGSIFTQVSKGTNFLIKKGAILVDDSKEILEKLGIKLKERKRKEEKGNIILEILKEGALSLEEIVEKTKLPPSKVATLISLLELEGKIKDLGNQTYAINYC